MVNKARICLAMLLCLCMVSCAVTPTSTAAASGTPASSTPTPSEILQGMKVLPQWPGLGSGNSSGFYYIDTRSDMSYNIRYIDYATQLDVVLCNRPECTHADESCGAWGAPEAAIPSILATDEKLYLLFPGGGWGYVIDGGLSYPGVVSMDLNGSNRTNLFTAEPNQLVDELNAMNEDVFLTVLYTTYQNGDEVITEREVITINRHTGHKEKLFSVEDMVSFVGVTESGMLWLRLVYDESSGYNTAYFRFLEEVDLQTGETRIVREWGSQEPDPMFQHQYGYMVSEDKTILEFNLQSGEERVLCSPYTNLEIENPRLFQVFSDTLVAIDVRPGPSSEQDDGQSLVNLYTGQTSDTTLTFTAGPEDGTYQLPVRIMAEAGDKFLVTIGAEVKPVEYNDGSGNPTVLPHPVEEHALVSKSDFWNNIPNYEPVTRLA